MVSKMSFQELFLDDDYLDDVPLSEYPRPQMKRNSYLCLNGEWDFEISKKEKVETYSKKILIPFPPESSLSKVNIKKEKGEYLFYKKVFCFPSNFIKEKILLHFGAVDQICWVYFNGKEIAYHEGGYLPFTIEIPLSLVDIINVLEVKVKDDLDKDYPYGKQSDKRGGMWYTPISGIWKTVWCESVYNSYIEKLIITPIKDVISIKVIGNVEKKTITIYTPEGECIESFFSEEFVYKINNPRFWSPDDPYLYQFKIKTTTDEVKSYFALRYLSIEEDNGKKYLFVNGGKFFFHGLLDQSYFPDGIYTPKRYSYLEEDITRMKSLGFNTLRMHIKVEADLFYYYCDKHGMIVFQDMVNNSPYSFFSDTVMPTLGFLNKDDTKIKRSKKAKEIFEKSMIDTVLELYNHPSIFMWTIFNEGWGQFNSSYLSEKLMQIDDTRFIDSTSGWFDNKKSQICSKHIYFKKLSIKNDNRPIIISEFGGYSYKIISNSFNIKKTYGYKKFSNKKNYELTLKSLYLDQVVPLIKKGLCGVIYTQLSDVEDETNGLLTYDRKILKVDQELLLEIASKLHY